MYYYDYEYQRYYCDSADDGNDEPTPDPSDDGDDKEKSVLQTIDQALKTAYNYMKDLIEELKSSKPS